jgi:hypothetical protein
VRDLTHVFGAQGEYGHPDAEHCGNANADDDFAGRV